MVNFHKIDEVFESQAVGKKEKTRHKNRRAGFLYFLKVSMVFVAAFLVVLILVLPTLKSNSPIEDFDLTLPKKGELEKVHIENTLFSRTDKDNKISTFTSDVMDETVPGSKIYKIINPKGHIPTGGENVFVDVRSDVGYYHQAVGFVELEKKVVAVYDRSTTVETEYADYDFQKAYASGNKDVYAYGDWGKLWSKSFSYDKTKSVLTLYGKSKIISENKTLWADEKIKYYQFDNKVEAIGNVKSIQNDQELYADRLVIYLADGQTDRVKKVEAFGNVILNSKDGTAKGDRGVFWPESGEAELYDNVSVEQNGNIAHGQKAVTNLKTSVSKIMSEPNKKTRVSGVIRGTTVKGKSNDQK